ncbi:short chain dehydrogenase [Rhizoctonia solani]|uniref:Short chain dehydrogenase n=1 Tax=Rhizoctonia solani TaxID=456999 RepID=A0A8H8SWQ3_9AGAM|nr:short chain dehydrogenase [Rhizoctonia solani]QRW20609.1 short chain dehydrogenase [Rhizoctonia solani]
MRFTSLAVLSILSAVLGTPVQVKRQEVILNGGVVYCKEAGFQGVCVRASRVNNSCNNFDSAFDSQVSSFRPEPQNSISCLLWSDPNCQGTNPGGWISGTGINDLDAFGFGNVASSFQCKNP